ncbi:MAG: hypothetical protein HY901_31465 [Deltaproteobacteria bacterium]|nr:hypothetical protein [Deltaproteobacteria bacterium]
MAEDATTADEIPVVVPVGGLQPARRDRNEPLGPLELQPAPAPARVPAAAFQRLWYACQARPWRSLALVALQSGDAGLAVARGLEEVAAAASRPVLVIEALGAQAGDQAALQARARLNGQGEERVLIALSSFEQAPGGIPLARDADLVLFCVRLGEARIEEIERAIELVGRERIGGCVVVRAGR